MLNVELYINDVKVDLFEDENIIMTDTIQDVRDIGSLFTAFTQNFSLPASKANNKIFKHYYNNDIIGGFDGRFSLTSTIRISGADYKRGSIKLVEVKMKGNKAYSYSVRFYGDGIDLRDTLSNDDLGVLDLSDYNHAYSGANTRIGLEHGLGLSGGTMTQANGTTIDRSILYPLISHTKRYVYDSTATPEFYDTTDTNRLEYQQLKPAILLIHIIEAIETDYGVEFTRDFFGDTVFEDLYMWMNRNKGLIEGTDDSVSYFNAADWSHTSGTDNAYWSPVQFGWMESYRNDSSIYPDSYAVSWDIDFDIATTGSGTYDLVIMNNADGDNVLYQENNITVSASKVISLEYGYGTTNKTVGWGEQRHYIPKIKITAEGTVTTVDVETTMERTFYEAGETPVVTTGVYDIAAITTTTDIDVSGQLPKQKTIDFLMGVFKMFNLTAYVQDDGKIYVDTLDNFYAAGTEIDITEYVDVSESSIKPGVLYDNVDFKYQDTETKLIAKREELIHDRFGDLSYSLGNVFGNNTYTVELPFSHIMFENIEDDGTGSLSDILLGLYIDADDNSLLSAPLIFYNDGAQSVTTPVEIVWEYDSGAVATTSYQRAGNTRSTTTTQTLNFNSEFDEFTLATNEESLFSNYYETYISEVYGVGARLVNVNAYLPLSFILNYNMNDKLIIHNKKYKINSVEISLMDGKSRLGLIPDILEQP